MSNVTKTVTLTVVSLLGLSMFAKVGALVPSSSGVISGCYKNANGALSIIDAEAGQTCGNNETAISWNQQSGGEGTTTYAKRVYVEDGATNFPVISIPEFGDITANCSANTEGGLVFTNTTDSKIFTVAYHDINIGPGQQSFIPRDFTPTVLQIIPENGDSETDKIVNLTVSGERFQEETGQCRYAVTAEVF